MKGRTERLKFFTKKKRAKKEKEYANCFRCQCTVLYNPKRFLQVCNECFEFLENFRRKDYNK